MRWNSGNTRGEEEVDVLKLTEFIDDNVETFCIDGTWINNSFGVVDDKEDRFRRQERS